MPQPPASQPSVLPAPAASTGLPGKTVALVSIGGFALAALGSLLPWATLTTGFGSVSVNGTDGDGIMTLLMGLAGSALMFLAYSGKSRTVFSAISIVLALIIAFVGIVDAVDVSSAVSDGDDFGIRASVGIGLYLVIIGGLVGGLHRHRAHRQEGLSGSISVVC